MPTKLQTAFLSYSRKDSEFALKLSRDLENAGIRLWVDGLDTESGKAWDLALEEALTASGIVLAVMSPDAVQSDFVMSTVHDALERNKPVIPLLYRDCELPPRLSRIMPADFRNDYAQGLRRLLLSLADYRDAAQAASAGASDESEDSASEQNEARLIYSDIAAAGEANKAEGARLQEQFRAMVGNSEAAQQPGLAKFAMPPFAQPAPVSGGSPAQTVPSTPAAGAAFICYSHDDRPFALQLAKDLRNKGARVWMDKLDVRAGKNYRQMIEKALASCDRMIVILSPASVDSPEVEAEYTRILQRKKEVIPVLYQQCEVPYRLCTVEYADFTGDYEQAIDNLLLSLSDG